MIATLTDTGSSSEATSATIVTSRAVATTERRRSLPKIEATSLVAFTRAHLMIGHRDRPRSKTNPTDDDDCSSSDDSVDVSSSPRRKLPWPASLTLPWPRITIFLDSETTSDRRKQLQFGAYRVVDDGETVHDGLYYHDDLDAAGLATLRRYAERHAVELLPASVFVKRRLAFWGYRKHHQVTLPDGTIVDHMRGAVGGFNLAFDAGSLAVDWVPTEKERSFWNGWSLTLADYKRADGSRAVDIFTPPIHVKQLKRGRLFRWGSCKNSDPNRPDLNDAIPEGATNDEAVPGYHYPGRFIDCQTFAESLAGKHFTLEGAYAWFVRRPWHKRPHDFGILDDALISYCRDDTARTAELHAALLAEWARWDLDGITTPDRIQSSAGLAKAHLRKIGLHHTPPIVPSLGLAAAGWTPDAVQGACRAAFYAGRLEARVRRWPVPVVTLDVASAYATTFVLLDLWPLLTARRIVAEDATEDARKQLDTFDTTALLRPETWPKLTTICEVEPDNDVLPVRARFGPRWRDVVDPDGLLPDAPGEDDDNGLNTTLPRIAKGPPQWWGLPDCLVSKLETGKAPHIRRAIRFVANGQIDLSAPIRIRSEIPFDPKTDNLVAVLLAERARRKAAGDTFLDAILKQLANATAYGLLAEERVGDRHPKKTTRANVRAWSGEVTPRLGTLPAGLVRGAYHCAVIASAVTSGTRLLVGLIDHLFREQGGTVANLVIDGLSVVATEQGGWVPCPGGPGKLEPYPVTTAPRDPSDPLPTADGAIWALWFAKVDAVRAKVAALSPIGGDLLRLESENHRPDGSRRPLMYFGTASLRYSLFDAETGELVKASAHLIGSYEYGELAASRDRPLTEDDFAKAAATEILRRSGALDAVTVTSGRQCAPRATGSGLLRPDWLNCFVSQSIAIRHPSQLSPFSEARPFGFYSVLHQSALEKALTTTPDLPPAFDWRDGRGWVDEAGNPVSTITGAEADRRLLSDEPTVLADGGPSVVVGQTWSELLDEYSTAPETRMLGPDGNPCRHDTVGLLRQHDVWIRYVRPMGKKAGQLRVPPSQDETRAWLRSLTTVERCAILGCTDRQARRIVAGTTRSERRLAEIAEWYSDAIRAYSEGQWEENNNENEV
jgi:hypothetical protein